MIIQVGHFPPPIGGISVYIERFKDFLDVRAIPNKVWDVSNIPKHENAVTTLPGRFFSIPAFLAKEKKIDIIHFNITGKLSKVYLGLFNRLFFQSLNKVITIHGDSAGLFGGPDKVMKTALNTFDAVICVKENDKSLMRNHGVTVPVYEIPAFIPPSKDVEKDHAAIPPKIWKYYRQHHPVLLANANKIVFRNGLDLYGMDMCVDLCRRLKPVYPDLGFVFCIPNYEDDGYVKEQINQLAKEGLDDNFMLIKERIPLYPLIQESDVFLRPTTTDGDALSVREALHYKIPTIVSDAVERPQGCILFKTRDHDDFYQKTMSVLNNPDENINQLDKIEIKNNAGSILNVYHELNPALPLGGMV